MPHYSAIAIGAVKAKRDKFVNERRRAPVDTKTVSRRVGVPMSHERVVFEQRKGAIITKPDEELDGPADVVQDGEYVAICLGICVRAPKEKSPHVFIEPARFMVGAKHFGLPNRQFNFPQGFDIVKQAPDKATIVTPHERVTFVRSKDGIWSFCSYRSLTEKAQRAKTGSLRTAGSNAKRL